MEIRKQDDYDPPCTRWAAVRRKKRLRDGALCYAQKAINVAFARLIIDRRLGVKRIECQEA